MIKDPDNLVIICHGLEGNTTRAYIQGMAKYLTEKSWSVLAWNLRGCSEEINKTLRFYHSGATDDLDTVIQHVLSNYKYKNVFLLGFSLGGNLALKYLGEQGQALSGSISKCLVFSVPLNLHDCCLKISGGFNQIYGRRFLKMLKKKVRLKASLFPDAIALARLNELRDLIEFDDYFTAPVNGFENAIDYYQSCSSVNFINEITIPTLIVNALNDPFLSKSCYLGPNPQNSSVETLTPFGGGHCGFADRDLQNGYWSEVLAWNYLNRNE